MITVKQWMEVCNYKITEGGEYYPGSARIYSLDSWNGEQSGHSLFIGFDTKTQDVYIVEVHDYKNERSYRLINPKFKQHFADKESAYDGVDFIDLEVDEDFIEKATAIVMGKPYDETIMIQVEFTDQELLTYMKMAHESKMTFNDFVNKALREFIDTYDKS